MSSIKSTHSLLAVKGLCKQYSTFKLDNISFSLEHGSISGFIGRNGAGKTTALRCIVGSAIRDAGSVQIFGHSLDSNEASIKQIIGIVFGGALYYETKQLSSIVSVARRFYTMWDDKTYRSLIQRFSLDESKRVQELSQGMRVKFALAIALSHDAKLLILDEPTSGLDPLSRDELLDLFLDLASDGKRGILFSTHITSDLEKCADSIVHIRTGKIEAACSLSEYKNRYRLTSAEEARRSNAQILGTRRNLKGHTALVKADTGIGRKANLEEIMTHIDREETK